jgi:RNA polymerase sigma-70 factor (ECF subfamily)
VYRRAKVDLQETTWIRACLAGDVDAYQPLVERYQGRIFNFCARMLGDRAEAEDLTQETFLRAYKALGRFDLGSPFVTWLYRIAANACVDRRRKKKPVLLDQELEVAVDATAIATIEARTLERAVQRALLELKAEHRTAVVLRDIEGLSYEEMTGVLGGTIGALKIRVVRARAKLAKIMRQLYPGIVTELSTDSGG